MSRAVIYENFGGPEVLELREIPEPHPQPGEVRVRVTAAGLNPMDGGIVFFGGDLSAQFGISLPSGFGYDFAGVIDEVGGGDRFAVGDRVFGGAMGKAVADFLVTRTEPEAPDALLHAPVGISDEVAATLAVAGSTAVAALEAIDLRSGDTVLVGGAAGGVGVFAVQLARLAGARVIGTASETTFGFLQQMGVEPVAYGTGLADRVLALAPKGVSAATDLFGTETVEAALALGVPPERISAIAGRAQPSWRCARHRGQRSRTRCLGSDHRRDPAGPIDSTHRCDLPDRRDPCRRDTPGRTPCPRQDRGHSLTLRDGGRIHQRDDSP